jgi:hypothetical protein
MEFLRFGSSIPGSYWGCCAMDIIQCFNHDPDDKASIQIVDGDGGNPLTNDKGFMFAGPTYKDIFLQRLRYGTFGVGDMPNHGFLAILTHYQVNSELGKKWLKLLKENGFEFIRAVDNSVYSGSTTISKPGQGGTSGHANYLFALFRNIGCGALKDPYTPPAAWTELPSNVPEVWESMGMDAVGLTERVQEAHLKSYNELPKGKFMTEEELEKDGVPVTYAGLRSENPQEPKAVRLQRVEEKNKNAPKGAEKAAPFLPSVDASDYDDEYGCDNDWMDDYTDECIV